MNRRIPSIDERLIVPVVSVVSISRPGMVTALAHGTSLLTATMDGIIA